jgi:serine/threonine-protein kinase
MGSVHQAWDPILKRPCAIKLLSHTAAGSQRLTLRFLDEIRILMRLCHPNIVQCYDWGEEPGWGLFVVLELLPGPDLSVLLQDRRCLPLEEALGIVRQVGCALHAIHTIGVVHRDIKPANLVLASAPYAGGHLGLVKIIDFGLSGLIGIRDPERGSEGMVIGTIEYMPPEALLGNSSLVDARSDQYALAMVLYRMLCGRVAFPRPERNTGYVQRIKEYPPPPPRALVPSLPARLNDTILRALSKRKEDRFPTLIEFLRALDELRPTGEISAELEPARQAVLSLLRGAPEPEEGGRRPRADP